MREPGNPRFIQEDRPHQARRSPFRRLAGKAKRAILARFDPWLVRGLARRRGKELGEILGRFSERPVVIFPPTVPWEVPLFQRPHQLALALARLGRLVFFCNRLVVRGSRGFQEIEPGLFVTDAPFQVFRRLPSPLVFTLAYHRGDLDCLDRPRLVYEYIDELEVLPGDPQELRQAHTDLARRADLALATSQPLYQELRLLRADALLCPNGVDDAFIRQAIASTLQPTPELAGFVRQGTPIIGYYGALARWLDYDLLLQSARARPGFRFVLIGPDYDGSILTSGISGQENISWLGPRPYRLLPGYLKYFDVATIPFKLNKITHATSPLKLFEYMSAGKPCVTTAMHESARMPCVLIAQDAGEFVQKLDEALQLKDDPSFLARLEQVAHENTWEQRARSILAAKSWN